MAERKIRAEMGSTTQLGRRWTLVLSAMLGGNFCLLVWAVAGYVGGTLEAHDRNVVVADATATESPAPATTAGEAGEPDGTISVDFPTDETNSEVAEPSAKEKTDSAEAALKGVVIVNPATTGGTVHFVVDGEVHSLTQATYHCFAGNGTRRVIFHKGGEQPDVEQELSTGVFAFAVGTTGWELNPVDEEAERKLLHGCRLAAE